MQRNALFANNSRIHQDLIKKRKQIMVSIAIVKILVIIFILINEKKFEVLERKVSKFAKFLYCAIYSFL